jgi:hypothetical protein
MLDRPDLGDFSSPLPPRFPPPSRLFARCPLLHSATRTKQPEPNLTSLSVVLYPLHYLLYLDGTVLLIGTRKIQRRLLSLNYSTHNHRVDGHDNTGLTSSLHPPWR